MWAARDVIGSVTATVDFTEEMLATEQILFLDLGEKKAPVLQFKVVLENVSSCFFVFFVHVSFYDGPLCFGTIFFFRKFTQAAASI